MNQMEVVSELGVVYHQNHSLNLHLSLGEMANLNDLKRDLILS